MSQILSQEEVDALLKGISGGDVETEQGIAPDGGTDATAYDLTKPDKAVKLPKLVVITDKFSRSYRITLSNTIRRLAEVSFRSTDVKSFDEFLNEIPVPSNINIFGMEPLRGQNILFIDSALVFYFVDVLFGGCGFSKAKIEGREFTSIENTVIKKISQGILDEWSSAWESFVPVRADYQRSEVNPQFAIIVPLKEPVITITFNVKIENVSGNITICVPFSNLEPIKEKLTGDFDVEERYKDPFWNKTIKNHMNDVLVDLKVELGKTQLTANELINLSVGDVISLNKFIKDDLELLVEGVKKFNGLRGTYHSNNAIQISKLEDRR